MKNHRRDHEIQVIVLITAVIMGAVSPFAVGGSPDMCSASYATSRPMRHTMNTLNPLLKRKRSAVAKTKTAAHVASTTATSSRKPKSQIRRFIANIRSSNEKSDEGWKGGASTASISSRLLFTYVSPLLDLASNRTLTEDDAFRAAANQQMDHSVETLAIEYQKVRQKAAKKIEEQRINGGDKVRNSQSLLLLRALVNQQRGVLITTGILRLLNTGVQAFPAILVARLLRGIEAGNTMPLHKVVSSALLLVMVLSIKMVTENQFFHRVVNMSTKARGSLEGLIFDKSLRLPEGGSGVMAKQRGSDLKKALGSGGVLNLMQTDATIIESAAMQVHTLWDGPLQVRKMTR